MEIIWTKHAEERQREWQKKLGITSQEIEYVLLNPEQIQMGDQDALVAQSRRDNGLIRIPFVKAENIIKILTVYWTSKLDRYWKE